MKKLFTLIALLAMFMGAQAKEFVDAYVDFSTVTEIPRFSWGGSEAAFARLSLQDGCLHFHSEEATDPTWDCQFFPIGGVDAEVGVTYTLHFKVKGDHAGGVSMLGFGQTPYGQFQITTEWVEGTVEYQCTEANGNILMQCGDWIGDWDIAYLKITHEGKEERPVQWKELLVNGDAEKSWEDLGLDPKMKATDENNVNICFWTKEKGTYDDNEPKEGTSGDPHPAEIIELDGSKVFVCRAQIADSPNNADGTDVTGWDNQVWFESPRAWKTGEQFKLSFRYKADAPVVTNSQYHKQNPGDYLHWQAIGDISFTTEWQTFEQIVTVPADANGGYSIALNLNPNVKEAVNFYFDDLSWSQMVLDEGLFVASTNTATGMIDYDFDNAVEFVYDEKMDAMAATVGKAGDPDSWVNEVMISTVRGNDRQFKANTYKVKAAVDGDPNNWIDYESGASAKIKLPAQGVWTIYVDTDALVMAFEQVEGDPIKEPITIVPNETEVIINAVERDYTAEEAPEGYEFPKDGEGKDITGQPWDNQFFIVGNRALAVGEEVVIAFDYMAEKPATVGSQNSQGQGGYLHWAGLGNIDFTTEWQHFEQTVTIPGETSGNQNSWTFNLSNAKEANVFHFKNIVFKTADETETLIDMEGTANFWLKEGANTPAYEFGTEKPDAGITTLTVETSKSGKYVDGTKLIIVRNGKSYNVAGVEVK